MPSYRVTLGVGTLRGTTAPEDVLPAAVAAARDLATVEAWDLGVVRGRARITVRFTVDDDPAAVAVGGRDPHRHGPRDGRPAAGDAALGQPVVPAACGRPDPEAGEWVNPARARRGWARMGG